MIDDNSAAALESELYLIFCGFYIINIGSVVEKCILLLRPCKTCSNSKGCMQSVLTTRLNWCSSITTIARHCSSYSLSPGSSKHNSSIASAGASAGTEVICGTPVKFAPDVESSTLQQHHVRNTCATITKIREKIATAK